MNLTPENAKKFNCNTCYFTCSKESEWKRHIITRKHTNRTKLNKIEQNASPIDTLVFDCECGKIYKARNSLWYHKKKCYTTQGENTKNTIVSDSTENHNNETNSKSSGVEIDKEMLIKMLLKNQEVMEKMMEIIPTLGNNYHTITNTNSNNTTNNNQFNIQMFLKDHCKNAMNLTDFIDSLPITAETYDSTIDNGLTKTITNLITNGLSQLDILERPIHCTDASRKTLYVKEDNVWEKDNELVRMLLGIRQIAAKQRILINKWRDAHDDWNTNDRMQTRFTTLVCNSLDDIENNEKDNNKIIRSISKTVYLDNDMKNQYLE